MRLRPARPEWVARYGLAAFAHARADPADVPFLQVVVSDRDGRLPGERGRPACCACCPDLSHPDRPFVLPLDSTDLYDIVHVLDGRPASTVGVCVPVRVDGADVGRVERLVAEDLGNDRVRLLHPPLVADWTTAPASASTRPWAGCSACRA